MIPGEHAKSIEAASDSHLCWGLWQFTADPANETLDVMQMRTGNLHLNAMPFLEPPPSVYLTVESLQFNGNIIDTDIGLRHPFLGLDQFTGFDVCGILITNGSVTGFDDPDIRMAGTGDTRLLNPDGFTRWWNPHEFPNDGTIFGYTDGLLGAPDSIADFNSTINGYKFFCDDITEPYASLNTVDPASRCVFTAGQKNVRHYTIEMNGGLVFNYAVDANWKFPQGPPPYDVPDDFGPAANRTEAWNVSVTEVSNTLWNDGVGNGGDLSLSIDVWDHYNAEMNTVVIESPGNFDSESSATPTGGGGGYSTYELDITGATPDPDSIDILITIESEVVGYQGLLPGKTVAGYFLYTSLVDDEAPVQVDPPTVTEVIPDWGYLETTYEDVQIIGTNFISQGLDVQFETDTYSLPVSNITLVSDTEIEVDLDCQGAELGFYDVTVIVDNLSGPGTLEGTLEDGYRVGESWPQFGKNTLGNCLSNATGPESSGDLVYSVVCELAAAPETLLIGPDPDAPGERLVYFGMYSSSAQTFSAYNASDGSAKWSVSPAAPYNYYRLMAVAAPGVPCPDDEVGTVYVWSYPPSHAAPEQIVALSAHDGSVLWTWTAPQNGSWLHLERYGTVTPNGDFLFCHATYSPHYYYMTLLDKDDGTQKWQTQTKGHQTPDPVLSPDGSTIYIDVSSSNPGIQAYTYDDSSVTEKWFFSLNMKGVQQSGPIVTSDGTIVVAGKIYVDPDDKTYVKAITDDGNSASLKWESQYFDAEQVPWSQLAEGPDGSIYGAIGYPTAAWGPDTLYRFDPDDGTVIDQSAPMDGLECRSGLAIGYDGRIYAGADGNIYCFNADCSLEWSANTGRCTDAALDVDGSLFVADVTLGKLYRYQTE